MIIIIDNYDSFTYNLYQYMGEINPDIKVYRNDRITVEEIRKMAPSHIILSPGPGFPSAAGITEEAVKELGNSIPILGVCLGHQAIGEAYGALIVQAPELVHGKARPIEVVTDCSLFEGVPGRFLAGRYHSLIIDRESLPDCLIETAVSCDGEIMGIKHKEHNVFGIQFHPESILTNEGMAILKNFLYI